MQEQLNDFENWKSEETKKIKQEKNYVFLKRIRIKINQFGIIPQAGKAEAKLFKSTGAAAGAGGAGGSGLFLLHIFLIFYLFEIKKKNF